MAWVEPLRALHYDEAVAGPPQVLVSPPYDVIDDAQRAELAARSPFNAVHVDLPVDPDGDDPYAHAARLLGQWRAQGVLTRDPGAALWALRQDYTTPNGAPMRREGFFARVRVEPYGAGRIRPHERTHPAAKEDRLRLTRATQVNLSPIFALFSDATGVARQALAPAYEAGPQATVTDEQGTVHQLFRLGDPATITVVTEALRPAELLIADGHHRYETARVYAQEMDAAASGRDIERPEEGGHHWVLMCLVALEDPGLTVFPTHRLVRGTTAEQQEALAAALRRDFDLEEVALEEVAPPPGDGPLTFGYLDSHFRRAFHATLKDPRTVDHALGDQPEAYRRLDTAVLETLLLSGPLELSEEAIAHLERLGYARDTDEARDLVLRGDYDIGFFLRPAPVQQVRDVAAAGATMPPKSTFFFPKIPTGLLFNPLSDPE
ncbi:MAG TPA: DUF1015 domain-containing protein [Solirubrobacteraceae bacterium]|nr:DUF1015 domain-containing protein [Solirubrobacteraceae bacterium]